MTDVEKRRVRAIKWRARGWSFERIAQKLGLKDRRFAQMDVKRGIDAGLASKMQQ